MDATAAWDDGPAEEMHVLGAEPIVPDFSGFYAQVRGPVARALAVTLGDADLAADAADEALARAYASWAKVARMANPSGWVYRVGLNWARSGLRRRNQWHPGLTAVVDPGPAAPVEPSLVAALAALSVRQRSVVVCRYLLGYSDHETSVALGLRPGTVRSSLQRGLRRLRDELGHLREEQ